MEIIDVESVVFSTVATVVRAQYSDVFMTGEAVAAPPKFPCVTLVEMNNSTYARTLDSSASENHAQLMYQIEIFSNLSVGKKSQCKAIVALIDTEMQKLGFVRIGNSPMDVPNSDRTIYRMVARYRGVISKDLTVYRR